MPNSHLPAGQCFLAKLLASLLLMPALLTLLAVQSTAAQNHDHHHHHHAQSNGGFVMNGNEAQLPAGCEAVSEDVKVTVKANTALAKEHPHTVFGLSERSIEVPSCARLTVTFVNEDDVRHQWMVHGLPHYLYPGGMFHIEAMGGRSISGTLIVPPESKTYLVHCDIAQHMEMGMKAQLKVAGGDGDLWSVPGISTQFQQSSSITKKELIPLFGLLAVFFAIGNSLVRRINR